MCAAKMIGLMNKEGMRACNEGRLEEALDLLQRAVNQARLLGVVMYEAKLRNNLGLVFGMSGRAWEARVHLRLALAQVEGRIGRDNRLYGRIEKNLRAVRDLPAGLDAA